MRSYESKNGEKHKAAEVVISLMQMLGRANAAAGDDRAEHPEEDIKKSLEKLPKI
jgi:single-stranded DNA-binding protein